jgi:glycosyltransferase involved in cell wall biosynthesis
MGEILLVSKPIEPPWNDGSKTLVRDLAGAMVRHVPVVLGPRGGAFALRRGRVDRIYAPGAGGHALSLGDGLRALSRIASDRTADLVHLVFQPNPRASSVARALARLQRRPFVQTIASAPRATARADRWLFADRNVALSCATEQRLREAGVRGVVRIAPPVAAIEVPDDPARRAARRDIDASDAPLLVFPGDLERGEGAVRALRALADLPGALLAMAYRRKSARTIEHERSLRDEARRLGVADRVRWVGETGAIHALLGAADVILFPSTDLEAKVDLPIVLIEAMWQGRALVIASGTPAAELAEGGAAIVVDTDRAAIASAVAALLDDEPARRSQGDRARASAQRRFEPSEVARRYEALYDELLG